jgi:hypothetical protein
MKRSPAGKLRETPGMPIFPGYFLISAEVEGGSKRPPRYNGCVQVEFSQTAPLRAPFSFLRPEELQMTRDMVDALKVHADALNRFRRATYGLDVLDRIEIAESVSAMTRRRRQGTAARRTVRGRRSSRSGSTST